ncbi:transcription termination factor NusA [Butyrivibrio fibrisolvens]|jgi:N utilization substance protein A|uniref:Transcription termination/antitermination protein NusA n=1 Tax=Butyrivibrio fibrisolvens TaxID=831 RepID=A0A317G2E1_BUTFI|nr:transcription termination factor NusA [Butyrivibrio fibrisolvens]PWT27496.1 transcription termination/antitermination protein NusA [Butyrivibrio fibrisolvens]
MSKELMEALDALEKEKNISKESLFDAIENSLMTACKNNFGKADNVKVEVDRQTCEFHLYAEKTVVETADDVMDPAEDISPEDAAKIDRHAKVGDIVRVPLDSKNFGRIATQNAKNVILQKIREEERGAIYNEYFEKEHDIVTGVVQRFIGRNISINLGHADAILTENEQVKGESYRPTDRIKVYILEVRNGNKGPRILVSRTHPDLVKRLFEQEVTEIKDGTVEVKAIAREAGSRTKIAVYSQNPNVDPVGACVGVNGSRVNLIVEELRGEKIDVIEWDENPGNLIQNALSPAKIVAVFADPDEKTAKVVVPDYQLSLAIGKEGQNARLAARLTGYKIDIKSETQAKDAPGFRYEDYLDDEEEYEDEEFSEDEIDEADEEVLDEEVSDEASEESSDEE